MAKEVIEILCRRDGINEQEAKMLVNECLIQMSQCNYEPDECESIMADILGLEPDYIFDLLM